RLLVNGIRLAQTHPQLFGEMRRKWRQHAQQRRNLLVVEYVAFLQAIEVAHHRGNGGVVAQVLQVVRHRPDGLVEAASAILLQCFKRQSADVAYHEVPNASEKTPDTSDSDVGEVTRLIKRTEKHQVHAQRVGSDAIEIRIRIDDVAAALA